MFRTKEQKRRLCECPVARLAHIIGDSVVLLIIRNLCMYKKRRFGDFAESLEGISTRTLTNKLRMLEDYKIISRKEMKKSPPQVQYVLTTTGRGLCRIIKAMKKYSLTYLS